MTSREALQEALAHARQGKFESSLSRLDEALRQAEAAQDRESIDLLARNAAVVADQSGDLAKAEQYYRAALQADEADPLTHFAIADVLRREGKEEVSAAHLVRCLELATANGDKNALELLEAVGFKKPD